MPHSTTVTMDTTCLYSTVKNISGGTKKFGFLPPHGRELADDGEFTVFGNILEAVSRGERATDKRHLNGLENAIESGYLEIRNTPAPILEDTSAETIHTLKLTGGTLGIADPCWTDSV